MAAVFPRVLIIVDSLLWLREVFNRGSVGGKQTIFCLCNSHQSHKHKHKINNGAESGLRSRRGFFSAWKPAASLLLVRKVCRRLLCSQDDLPHGTLQINHRYIPGNVSRAKMEASRFEQHCILVLIVSSCPDRIIIPNTIRQTCQKSPLKAGFVSEASFYLPEQYTDLCTCFHREDTDSFLPLLPLGKCISWVLCEGEPCSGDEGPPWRRFSGWLKWANNMLAATRGSARTLPLRDPMLGLSHKNSTWGLGNKTQQRHPSKCTTHDFKLVKICFCQQNCSDE